MSDQPGDQDYTFTKPLSSAIKPVCVAEILPNTTLYLNKWPNRWVRFWHWVFFGVVWRKV